ncbi:MAG: DUF3037 domain-containing protein [Candidatus Wallbacteria bacterium]|nr:DUF3037 domain-containing protein [Candidatus Wallbacteria bacterium]
MGQNLFSCNYAVIRFLPYSETQEFVNIGVAIMCPQTGYFDYKMEQRRRDRVRNFFPELEPDIFIIGRRNFKDELCRVKKMLSVNDVNKGRQTFFDDRTMAEFFIGMTKSKESLFRFGNPGSVLTADPQKEMVRLFNLHVGRQFAQREEYQEEVMRKHLERDFRDQNIIEYVKAHLGVEDYSVSFPFVRDAGSGKGMVRAVKPLHLAKDDPTKIYEHGDAWTSKIYRLKKLGYKPDRFLFTLKLPAENNHCIKAANEVCEQLHDLKARWCLLGETKTIIEFARQA